MRRILLVPALVLVALSAFPRSRDRFSYVFARSDAHGATISKGSLESLLKLRKRFNGSYLWARIEGREYLIRDAATLDEVHRAARDLDALNREYDALHRRMKPLQDREDRLDRQVDAISDKDDEKLTGDEHARLRQLESQLREVERELRVYEREESKIDQREEALDREFDAEVERIVNRAIRKGVAQRL